MTFLESMNLQNSVIRRFEAFNNMGNMLQSFGAAAAAISKPAIEACCSLNQISRMFPPDLLNAAHTVNSAAQAIHPASIGMAYFTAEVAHAISSLDIDAVQFTRNIGVQLSPIIESLQNSIMDWNTLGCLASSVRTLAVEYGFYEDTAKEDLTAEDRDEVVTVVTEIISQPENWQRRLMMAFDRYKENNPLLAKLLIGIFAAFLAIFYGVASTLIAEAIKGAQVREEPKAVAPIVTKIEIGQAVIIIDTKPYYFEVEFEDHETGETYCGWISKRSVKVIGESGREDGPISGTADTQENTDISSD